MDAPSATRVQIFRYSVLKEEPLSKLENFSRSVKQLKLYVEKGCVCVKCGAEGSRLVLGEAKDGSKHWVVCTRDLVPLTKDHIVPRSLGGKNHIDNYQPMCAPCNYHKGDGIQTKSDLVIRAFDRIEPGQEVWRKLPKKGKPHEKKKPVYLGIVQEICENPATGKQSLLIERKEGRKSYFDEGKTYLVRAE